MKAMRKFNWASAHLSCLPWSAATLCNAHATVLETFPKHATDCETRLRFFRKEWMVSIPLLTTASLPHVWRDPSQCSPSLPCDSAGSVEPWAK